MWNQIAELWKHLKAKRSLSYKSRKIGDKNYLSLTENEKNDENKLGSKQEVLQCCRRARDLRQFRTYWRSEQQAEAKEKANRRGLMFTTWKVIQDHVGIFKSTQVKLIKDYGTLMNEVTGLKETPKRGKLPNKYCGRESRSI